MSPQSLSPHAHNRTCPLFSFYRRSKFKIILLENVVFHNPFEGGHRASNAIFETRGYRL